MITCPDCYGEGFQEHDPNPPWMDDPEFRVPIKRYKCVTCRGEGKLTPLAFACRIAGGPPAPQATGRS